MFKSLIEKYVKNITPNDILEFAKKNNIVLNTKELELIYNHIKQNWQEIIYGDVTPILNNVKENTNSETYLKIENLYYTFYEKYKNYL